MADVVLYDHLVHPRLLAHAPTDAERIDVGTASPQAMAQEAICYLLAEKAREGKTVARLKWGDPFVFDRGGEEALFLHEQGVPFEVVPGIPAAIGIPGYAGVPLTYPGGGDTVTLVRGHEDESQTAPQIDWASLAKLKGTIVCYAGTRQLPAILESLVSHGRSRNDPAAVIYEGTLPGQHTVDGTLGELIEGTKAERPRRPAILVVGRVAALRQHLRWFDNRPLSGRRVVVTRPKEDAPDLSDRLAAAGAEAIEAPMTRISPPESWAPLDKAVEQIDSFGWIVFTSVNSVDHFMQRLYRTGDVRALGDVRVCAVGPSTRDRLLRYGLRSDLVPGDFRADGVVAALAEASPLRRSARAGAVCRCRTRAAGGSADGSGRQRDRRLSRIARCRRSRIPNTIRTSIGCCSTARSTRSPSRAPRASGTSRRPTARSRRPTCFSRRWSRYAGP